MKLIARYILLILIVLALRSNIVYSNPRYESVSGHGDKLIVKFAHCDSPLAINGGNDIKGFEIAGKDGKFHTALASIVGKNIVLSSSHVASPVAVRYAWAPNPYCDLMNKDKLPASPFIGYVK
ncbi:MAG: hypothetical protein KAS23_13055 [Anaerohalosphaera sp.]|nr:hypothetical protein [Anaerohalosphaera sp.]